MENYKIRTATIDDLDEITELERLCFNEKERADRDSFCDRLSTFPNHFYILELDGKIAALVNGSVAVPHDLTDEMYHDVSLHDENGDWQMIFGVETHPDYRHRGLSSILLQYAVDDARKSKRKGVVLTCKKELIPFYKKNGFTIEGMSDSTHGGAQWYQMSICF